KYVKKRNLELSIGDVVERHLINGDMVIFNRQPSLHKLSMMGHFCHINDDPAYMTLRLNVSATNPYNADLDGDEMNLHIPQTIQTVVEVRLIMNAGRHFVSPSTSGIVINIKQDSLFGGLLATLE